MGQALFLKTILTRDSALVFFLRNKKLERQETKGCQDGENKKGITNFAIPCIICLFHYIEKKSYLLYFIATILAHSVPSMAALTIPPAYPAPSPAG